MTEPALLPTPVDVVRGGNRRFPGGGNRLTGACSERLRRAFDRLPPLGAQIGFSVAGATGAVPALGDSYRHRIDFGAVTCIAADTEWGAIAALASVAQIGTRSFAIERIVDAPRYPWRGVMLDPARHFLPPAALRRTLDAMWFYKLNVLHLHLTDDQGFRLRSAAFPKLAAEQAYAPQELAELVAYAADRGIRIVPELDMPGHATSWLAAYPDWAPPGSAPPAAPSRHFGVHPHYLDTENPAVQDAVRTLLAELCGIFPDECIHFGGDEAHACDAAARAAFHRAAVLEIERLGKRAVGWDEALGAQLPRSAIVQAWRGIGARQAAQAGGFDCIVSAPYYLDLLYPADVHYAFPPDGPIGAAIAAEAQLPRHPRLRHVAGGIEWFADFADFPALPAVPDAARGRVLGGEACLWSELVTDELLDTRLWSRMPVIAERFWCAEEADVADVYRRMAATRAVLAELGIVAEDASVLDAYPQDLAPLIEMLEPVKWYRRLLGAAYAQRLQGIEADADRPYDVATPLNRIVDRISPESCPSRRAEAALATGADMAQWVSGWRRQHAALARHPEFAAELGAASAALARIADIVAGDAADSADAAWDDADALAGPHGEYLLPIAYALANLPRRRSPAHS